MLKILNYNRGMMLGLWIKNLSGSTKSLILSLWLLLKAFWSRGHSIGTHRRIKSSVRIPVILLLIQQGESHEGGATIVRDRRVKKWVLLCLRRLLLKLEWIDQAPVHFDNGVRSMREDRGGTGARLSEYRASQGLKDSKSLEGINGLMTQKEGVVEEVKVGHDIQRKILAVLSNLQESFSVLVNRSIFPHETDRVISLRGCTKKLDWSSSEKRRVSALSRRVFHLLILAITFNLSLFRANFGMDSPNLIGLLFKDHA